VARQQNSDSVIGEPAHKAAHVAHSGGVKARRRFVKHQQARLAKQGSRDAKPLPHSVRVATYLVLTAVAQFDRFKNLLNKLRSVAAVESCEQLEVCAAVEVRVEPWCLNESSDTLKGRNRTLGVFAEEPDRS
jgi:hypothetical protein